MHKKIVFFLLSLPIYLSYATEGFLAGTIIKTAQGLNTIENLGQEDQLLWHADEAIQQQAIITSTSEIIKQYIKIYSVDTYICCAPEQKFYVPREQIWVSAKNIAPSTILSEHFVVDHLETIEQEVICFAITVEHHHYYILDDVLVHNSACLALPITRIIIGSITAINPAITTIGIALGTVLVAELCRSHSIVHENSDLTPGKTSDKKNDYDTRKQQLEFLLHYFEMIHKELECYDQLNKSSFFTPAYFYKSKEYQYQPLVLPKINKKYATEQVIQNAHLQQLEHDTIKQQVTIAFHFDQIVQRKNNALQQIKNFESIVINNIALWNNNLDAISNQMICDSIEINRIYNELLQNFERKIAELKTIINYYKASNNVSILKNTSNIMHVIEQEETSLQEIIDYATMAKKTTSENQYIFEQTSAQRGINPPTIATRVATKIKALKEKIITEERMELERQRSAILFLNEDFEPKAPSATASSGGSPESPDDPTDPQKNRNRKNNNTEKVRLSTLHGMIDTKLNHYFGNPDHGLDPLLDQIGGKDTIFAKEKLLRLIIEELMKLDELPLEGKFKDLSITVNGTAIHVRGVVHEGIIKIATMFVPYK